MAGRPRINTNVLALRGAFENHPERMAARIDEPQGEPLVMPVDPPPYLNEFEHDMWIELGNRMHGRIMIDGDLAAFELMVMCMTEVRYPGASVDRWGYPHVHPRDPKKMSLLITLFSRFGMTPSDRSRVKVIRETKSGPADEFSR